jgi:hypothetical protein
MERIWRTTVDDGGIALVANEGRKKEGLNLLNLAYSPRVPPGKLAAMERVGKPLGLPLDALERLGQDEAVCDAFLEAATRGAAAAFAQQVQQPKRHLLVP